MGFEFNNKAPPLAPAFGAFKAIPALPTSKRGVISASAGPITGTSASSTSTRKDGFAPQFTFAPREQVTSDEKMTGESSALDFFLSSVSKPARSHDNPIYERDCQTFEDAHHGRLRSCDSEYSVRYSPNTRYLPSIAAHTSPGHQSESANGENPFRFLDPPGEMRNRVYQAGLNPGYISLRTCVHHFPSTTIGGLTLGLLGTSKQIAKETRGFLAENNFIVNISLTMGSRPVFSSRLIPEDLLPQIKHMTMVLDFSRTENLSQRTGKWYLSDWRSAQKLTGLQTLRICAIESQQLHFRDRPSIYKYTMKDILERIPSACLIEYGAENREEEQHIGDMVQRLNHFCKRTKFESFWDAHVLDPSELSSAAEAVKEYTVQGCKNGSNVDFRFVKDSDYSQT